MAKSNKLQNVKAIKQMLEGTHKFQTRKTHGYSDSKSTADRNKKRAVGDVWEEKIGTTLYRIEQFEGFRTKRPAASQTAEIREYLNSYPNCQKDCCKTTFNHMDAKMKKAHGMCYDCVIDMEHKLRVEGKFEDYEKERIHASALSWLKDAEQDVDALKKTFTQASEFVTNADGLTESWAAQMTTEEFEEKVEKQFEKFKAEFLANINKDKKEDEIN
tara:strand:+ start:200 stop:847 length:648 start_codon:yes stop_codon:yes gene_type:complete